MVVKDDNDIPIELGQLVLLVLASPQVKGRIIDIKDGGMLLGKRIKTPQGDAQQMSPGEVTVRVEVVLQFHPQKPEVSGLLVLNDPTPEKAEEIRKIYAGDGKKKSSSLLALN